jgi:alpha-glucosidase
MHDSMPKKGRVRNLSCAPFSVALACGLLGFASIAGTATTVLAQATAQATGAAASPIVSESLGGRAVRFHASAAARTAAHPSYALADEKGAVGPAPAAFPVTPIFGVDEGKQSARIKITPGTSLYGTGEASGPLLRNGRRIETWNFDAYGYQDDAPHLYKSHPWVLAVRPDGTAFGVLADTTYRCVVDTAMASADEILFIADGPAFPVIVIDGASPQEVVMELGRLTGYMPLPAKWTLGYHQCRYSYYPESRVREIAKGFRDRSIPADVIWFDIDYMAGFRVFAFNREYFPDPKKLNADLLADGFHNVWMINPGIKARDDASGTDPDEATMAKWTPEFTSQMRAEWGRFIGVRDSGLAKDVYVKTSGGTVYQGEVWPGWCYFPDYTSPRVRDWWAPFYTPFMAEGITGVWNDMNEPAVFNVQSKTMPESNRHAGDPTLKRPDGTPQGVEGAAGDHARYHNVYGMTMVKGTREGIQAANPDKRPFVLSRATYIGGQRYHAGWSGDNSANWFHVETSIPMVLNMGLSGFANYGPDIGGFMGNGDGDLFARWMGFGALLPFSRGHTGKDAIDKEPWSFGPKVEETSREALKRRYRLMPYFYSVFRESSVTGLPVARPLFFADPKDPALRSEDDGFLIGADVLVMAQVMPDRSRVPVMPKGIWREFEVSADPDLPRLYVRAGAIVPQGPDIQFVNQKPLDPLVLVVSLDEAGKASGTLYEDDTDGYDYQKGDYLLTTYEATRGADGSITVNVAKAEGDRARPSRNVVVRVLGEGGATAAGTGKDGETITVRPVGP